jgi:hypothetical protein
MASASKFPLISNVVRGKLPIRASWYGVLNIFHTAVGTGYRRYEFERLYLDHGDIWDYQTRPEEQLKY